MRVLFFMIFFVGCTSLRNENVRIERDYGKVVFGKSSGFEGSSYICSGHIKNDCKWIEWSFPEIEEKIKNTLNENKLKLVGAKYKEKNQGLSWFTFLSLGLVPSTMNYERDLEIIYSDSLNNTYPLKLNQTYQIMTGWFAGLFGTIKSSTSIHAHEKEAFMKSLRTEFTRRDK